MDDQTKAYSMIPLSGRANLAGRSFKGTPSLEGAWSLSSPLPDWLWTFPLRIKFSKRFKYEIQRAFLKVEFVYYLFLFLYLKVAYQMYFFGGCDLTGSSEQ
jgi:hypothetical protein